MKQRRSTSCFFGITHSWKPSIRFGCNTYTDCIWTFFVLHYSALYFLHLTRHIQMHACSISVDFCLDLSRIVLSVQHSRDWSILSYTYPRRCETVPVSSVLRVGVGYSVPPSQGFKITNVERYTLYSMLRSKSYTTRDNTFSEKYFIHMLEWARMKLSKWNREASQRTFQNITVSIRAIDRC